MVDQIAGPVLVTGASGFIGRRLCQRLQDQGIAVRALVLPHEKVEGILSDKIEIVRGDVTVLADMENAVRGIKTVYHLAAMVGDWGAAEMHARVTVGGTINLFSACAQSKPKIVLIASIVVYGSDIGKEICHEKRPYGPNLGPYSRSKQQQEIVAREMAQTYGIDLSVVRPANVYGVGSGPWVKDVAEQLKSGLPCLLGNGKQNAGLVHVDNLVSALILVGSSPKAVGQTYNVCDGSTITWGQYFGDLAKILKVAPPKSVPHIMGKTSAILCEKFWNLAKIKGRPPFTLEAFNLVSSHHQISIDKIKSELGYVASTEYEQAMKEIAKSLV